MQTKFFFVLMLLMAASTVSAQNISFEYDADGNVELRYTLTLRSSQMEETELETTANVSIELDNSQITIYPNPTRGEICVEITAINQEEDNIIRIFDSSGHLIETKQIESERTYIDISGESGVYLLNIHLGKTISKWKIIKQ